MMVEHVPTGVRQPILAFTPHLRPDVNSRLPTTPPLPVQLSGAGFDPKTWCGAHPNLEAHALLAAQLERFVQGILPSWR